MEENKNTEVLEDVVEAEVENAEVTDAEDTEAVNSEDIEAATVGAEEVEYEYIENSGLTPQQRRRKEIWDKITTGILIFLMASPVLILVYIFLWFIFGTR